MSSLRRTTLRGPLQGVRNFAVDRPQRRKWIAAGKPVQMRILPAKGRLKDVVYLTQ
jgi:hypothetical protein